MKNKIFIIITILFQLILINKSLSSEIIFQATDIEIHANEVLSLKKRLNEIYSKHTGKSVDEIKSALERDNFMTPDNAKDFGLSLIHI